MTLCLMSHKNKSLNGMIKLSSICTPEEIAWIKIIYKLFNGQKMFVADKK